MAGTEFTLNGRTVSSRAEPMTALVWVLRGELGLQGTKVGCAEGRCGACTVIVDGRAVVSCLFPVVLADGATVRTVEGLAGPDDPLTPLQDALLEHGAVQCGACTPGVLMSLTALLDGTLAPTEGEVREALTGNICRCTGYHKIVEATLAVANGVER